MKAVLRSSQLSYELLERIALQIRAAKENQSVKVSNQNSNRKGKTA